MKKQERIENFRGLGIGMFVHFGLYSMLGKGEWARELNTPHDQYDRLISEFYTDFDADKFVSLAKCNGFKYIVFTARHHDGFSLYDTKGLSNYDIMFSPTKKDLVRLFVDACKKYEIVPIIYHTLLDWYDERYKYDFANYLVYLRNSIQLLCTQYGQIGGFWFDGEWDSKMDMQYDKLYAIIRKHQENAIIVNNSGLSKLGEANHAEIDCVTFERGRARRTLLAGEVCQIVNSHWGYAENDINYKSVKNVLVDLIDARKNGANFLLNLAPNGEGKFSHMELGLMQQLGKWISRNEDCIYNVKPYSDGFISDGKFLYCFVDNLGVYGDENVNDGCEQYKKIKLCAVEQRINSITLLDCNQRLNYTQDCDGIIVEVPNFNYGENLIVRVLKINIGELNKA